MYIGFPVSCLPASNLPGLHRQVGKSPYKILCGETDRLLLVAPTCMCKLDTPGLCMYLCPHL